jgi:hypothetical protein
VGTAMLWGAFGVTLFGIFLTPVFYSVVRWFSGSGPVKPAHAQGADAAPAGTILEGSAEARPGAFDAGHQESRIRKP